MGQNALSEKFESECGSVVNGTVVRQVTQEFIGNKDLFDIQLRLLHCGYFFLFLVFLTLRSLVS